MLKKQYKLISCMIILGCSLIAPTLWAAKAVDLRQEPLVFSNTFVEMPVANTNYQIIKSAVDQNHTSHVRIQQTYKNYPVFGAEAIMHIPNTDRPSSRAALNTTLAAMPSAAVTYNGIIYQDLESDLMGAPAYVFGGAQADKALAQAKLLFQQSAQQSGQGPLTQSKASLMVYVDENSKAHWAYRVTFKATPKKGMPAKPVCILDALTLTVYEQWDEVVTLSDVEAGGYGGNPKMGKLSYDGLANNLPKLIMERNDISKKCLIENDEVLVKDRRSNDAIVSFKCKDIDKTHNEYWNDSNDEVNSGFSPSNDALYGGKIIKSLYEDWYHLPVLIDSEGNPLWLSMRVHDDIENAYWDGEQMTFGDGSDNFYPLVSLGIVAHEVSHGFTHQHSGLVGIGQAGGLNEAFSDMAAQAVQFYMNKPVTWQMGAEVMKDPNGMLRSLSDPTLDCPKGHLPGVGCSIDNMREYYGKVNVHFSCGIFNKLFYLMATSPDWDVKKAFDVMVQANVYYWTYNTSFLQAACGLVSAAKDLKYDTKAIDKAAASVGLHTTQCFVTKPQPTQPPQQPKSPDDGGDDAKTKVSTPWG